MIRYQILIEYVGTNFIGWQVQKKGNSIQGLIQQKISKILKEKITVSGSGRTDSGVHAIEQSAHFDCNEKIKDHKRFFKIATDKHLSMKAEVEEMVSAGVLRKIGNQVIFIDEVLGDTIDDTVVHLKDKKNSGKLTILRAKLKELSLV